MHLQISSHFLNSIDFLWELNERRIVALMGTTVWTFGGSTPIVWLIFQNVMENMIIVMGRIKRWITIQKSVPTTLQRYFKDIQTTKQPLMEDIHKYYRIAIAMLNSIRKNVPLMAAIVLNFFVAVVDYSVAVHRCLQVHLLWSVPPNPKPPVPSFCTVDRRSAKSCPSWRQ